MIYHFSEAVWELQYYKLKSSLVGQVFAADAEVSKLVSVCC